MAHLTTVPIPTPELVRVATLTRDHLQEKITAFPHYRYALAVGTGAISVGLARASELTDPGLQRAYLVGALNGGGEQLCGALDRHPEIDAAIPDLRDDAIACLALAAAAKGS